MTLPTFCITTFLRPAHLRRLVSSILARYPAAKILVADNGVKPPYRQRDVQIVDGADVVIMPYDCGLSACRNWMLDHTTGDVVILDDDFAFTPDTNIEAMQDVLASDPEVGVVCGRAGITNVISTENRKTPNGTEYGIVPLSDNFALIRRELINDGHRWDPVLHLGEHWDFFERLQRTRWKAALVPSVSVDHNRESDDEYTLMRNRVSDYRDNAAHRQDIIIPDGQQIVCVLGCFRGGTSCVAGMLHKLGVSMGDDLKAATYCNPTGFYESELLAKVCRTSYPEPWFIESTDREWRVQELMRWAAKQPSGVIGAKHPTLCLMVPELLEAWPNVKIISVHRPLCDAESSILKLGWGWPPEAVRTQLRRMIRRRDADIAEVSADILTVPYQYVVRNPSTTISILCRFLDVDIAPLHRMEASGHADYSLQHFGSRDES